MSSGEVEKLQEVFEVIKKLNLSERKQVKIKLFLKTVSYYKIMPYVDFIKNNPEIAMKINKKINGKDAWDAVVFLYRYNIQLSKAIYPYIYVFETVLKTKINKLFLTIFKKDWYKDEKFISTFNKKSLPYIQKQTQEYLKGTKNSSINNFVENYTMLGYWVTIIDNDEFWNSSEIKIRELFTQNNKINPILLKKKDIIRKIRSIKDLRNAVSHYNRIIGCKIDKKGYSDLKIGDVYQNILYILKLLGCEEINWMIGDLDCCSKGSFEALYREFEFVHNCEIRVDKSQKEVMAL